MPSVAARILLALQARLLEIRGQGAMVNDLQGRVFLRRPSFDAEAEETPAVFLMRRVGGGAQREQRPGENGVGSDTTVIFDAVGLVASTGDSTLAAEHLLADMQRALEIPNDTFLRESCLGKNLLTQELRLVSIELDPPIDVMPFELVGVGVQCAYPHEYGDPDHVA